MIVLQLVKTSIGGNWALRQMIELVKLGVEVHVALPTDGPLINQYVENGIRVHELNYSLKNIFRSAKGLRRIVHEVSPDIIHSNFVITTIIMRLALRDKKIPRVFQVPGPLHLENWFFRNLDIMLAQKCDYWIGSCQWTNRRYIQSGVSEKRLFHSNFGIDIDFNRQYQKGLLRQELGLHKTDFIFGLVAYMYAPKYFLGQRRGIKGHEDFIDAITIVSQKYPNVYGVCIGGPATPSAKKYESKIIKYSNSKTNHMFFLGTRTNPLDLYQDFDCAVYPSHSENLGSACDALLFKIPTIATSVGGLPDLVINKETGLLVPSKNPIALALAMEQVINGEVTDEMCAAGRNLVISTLQNKDTTRNLFNIYKTIIEIN